MGPRAELCIKCRVFIKRNFNYEHGDTRKVKKMHTLTHKQGRECPLCPVPPAGDECREKLAAAPSATAAGGMASWEMIN